MLWLSRLIDKVNESVGKFAAWAILLAVLFAVFNALARKIYTDWYLVAFDDAQWQLFSATFMLCAPWTLLLNEHIRVDIINERFSASVRCWIDIIGHGLVLIPFCIVMVYISIPWAIDSFLINEQSEQYGGLPKWPPRFLVPIGFTLLGLQAFSELIKRVAVLQGKIDDPYAKGNQSMEDIADEIMESTHA